jgi:hypothetical protein
VPLDFPIGLPSRTSNPAEHSEALISLFYLTLQEFGAWFSFSVDQSKAQKTIPFKRKDTMNIVFLVYFCAKYIADMPALALY